MQLHLYNPHSDSNAVTEGEAPGMVYTLCGERHPLGMLAVHFETVKNVTPGSGREEHAPSAGGDAAGPDLLEYLESHDILCFGCSTILQDLEEQGHVRKWSDG